jgi:predicted metal-dependent phosphoesterase TrpH
MPDFDLHSHSNASDGTLAPRELVAQAAAAGISRLALTDHDTTQGLPEATAAALEHGLELIPAVEISTQWRGHSVHIVGVHIDPVHDGLSTALAALREIRTQRAERIADALERGGFQAALETTRKLAGDGMITRTHFAQYIVQSGRAKTVKAVFERFLTPGKPGYVATCWPELADAVDWINRSGGQAILAHPQRYKLSATARRELAAHFKEAGGAGIEVVAGTGHAPDIQANAELARRFGLLASAGSDFHSNEHCWLKLGRLPALPPDLVPIWARW